MNVPFAKSLSIAPSGRSEVEFLSGRALCRGWLYRPSAQQPASCIVMAHGLGGTRNAGLQPFAERFAAQGHAVLVFDYRGFGASEGAPRQVVSVRKQLQDWQAAIDFARSQRGVDPQRIALWGSSFSGGHVVRAAVADGRIKAVSAQCPMMDGLASSLAVLGYAGPLYTLRLVAHGVYDLLASVVGKSHLIPLAARRGAIAAMSSADAEAGLRAIMPRSFINAVGARIAVVLAGYRPGLRAGALRCPILIQLCERDTVAPARAARAAARRAGQLATVRAYPVGHFDLYVGEAFDRCVADQVEFFERHLGPA